jgi:hypothetical protein
MTKQDLRTGMLVTVRCGEKYMVFLDSLSYFASRKNALVDLTGTGWLNLDDYENDLTIKNGQNQWDIVKVSTPKFPTDVMRYADENRNFTTRWEREEPKELTVSEIEKLLGYPVKIVKE